MPLEAILIAVDNSDSSRNGDYTPTRLQAQSEAVGYLANAKLQENQESSVGLMTMAGSRINVLCSPGREPGQLLNALAKVRPGGDANFLSALKTAQLALKNRQNKNQRQRVILFVCSPVTASVEELVKLGKLLKKNNVALDVVNFGAENMANDNTEKLEQLIATVNTADNSHLVSIPPGPHIFADLVLTSAIMSGGGAAAGAGMAPSAAGGVAHPGGVDPEMDPELAMVLRMSMEEERQRQQRAAGAEAKATGTTAAPAAGAAMEDDEEALLAQAIALSMQENVDMSDATPAAAAAGSPAPATPAAAASATAGASGAAATDASAADIDLAMSDPDFINSLLSGVPGAQGDVDNLLDQLTGSGSTDVNKPAEKKDEGKK